MIKLARHKLALEPEALISSNKRLVTASGLVDLETGQPCPPDTEDYGLRRTPVEYNPDATCPRWEQFIAEVMGKDQEMMDFLQRLAGYCATGLSTEQVLLIFSGTGNNGKGVFLRTLTRVLGEYACTLNPDFLTGRRYISHPTDLEQLRSARLAVAGETAVGDSLDEARVKMMTGGDIIKARGIAKDFSAFDPTFTIIMPTNNLPEIHSQDDGMWRRLVVVPWQQQWVLPGREHIMPGVPVADPQLDETLKDELPGILAWCVRGAMKWFEQGLALPKVVQEASLEYRKEQDSLSPFCLEHIVPDPRAETSVTDVYRRYCDHQESIGEPAFTTGQFFPRMKRRYKVLHREHGNVYLHIRLKELKADRQGS
jgi:putative DNA primase/helicase